jgi:hypothetical protein
MAGFRGKEAVARLEVLLGSGEGVGVCMAQVKVRSEAASSGFHFEPE